MSVFDALDGASEEPGCLLAPAVVQHCLANSVLVVVSVRSGPLHVDLVSPFSCLAAEVAPQHDLRRRMNHRVYLLAVDKQKPTTLPERKQQKSPPHFLKGSSKAHKDTNRLARASRRCRSCIVFPKAHLKYQGVDFNTM